MRLAPAQTDCTTRQQTVCAVQKAQMKWERKSRLLRNLLITFIVSIIYFYVLKVRVTSRIISLTLRSPGHSNLISSSVDAIDMTPSSPMCTG